MSDAFVTGWSGLPEVFKAGSWRWSGPPGRGRRSDRPLTSPRSTPTASRGAYSLWAINRLLNRPTIKVAVMPLNHARQQKGLMVKPLRSNSILFRLDRSFNQPGWISQSRSLNGARDGIPDDQPLDPHGIPISQFRSRISASRPPCARHGLRACSPRSIG